MLLVLKIDIYFYLSSLKNQEIIDLLLPILASSTIHFQKQGTYYTPFLSKKHCLISFLVYLKKNCPPFFVFDNTLILTFHMTCLRL